MTQRISKQKSTASTSEMRPTITYKVEVEKVHSDSDDEVDKRKYQ